MGLMVKETGGDFEKIPTGVHSAVCARYYDLGMQPGFEGSTSHKVVILWEIAEKYKTGDLKDKQMRVSKTYTLSLNGKANLRKDLESWRGRPFTEAELQGFDLDNIINKQCTLNLTETISKAGKKWTGVAAIMPPLKDAKRITAETPADYVPEWIKKLLETQRPDAEQDAPPPPDDDIPF